MSLKKVIDGRKLFQLRTDRDWSRRELADKIKGVSNSTISDWENKNVQPSKKSIEKLCEIFKIDANDLLCEKEVPDIIDRMIGENTNFYKNSFNGNGHIGITNSGNIMMYCNHELEEIEKEILLLKKCDKETIFEVLNIIKKHKK